MQSVNANRVLQIAAGVCLILFPLLLMTGFASHFNNFNDVFDFKLKYEPNTSVDFMQTLTERDTWRLYIIPHILSYLGVIVSVPAYLYLSYLLFQKRPWLAIIGGSLSILGSLFFSGVFAIWLSFTALSNLQADQIAGAIPALDKLTEMQGALEIITIMASSYLLGTVILMIGLFISRSIPRWAASLVIVGCLIIIAFIDLDNWMFIGTFLMLLGFLPVSLRLLKKEIWKRVSISS